LNSSPSYGRLVAASIACAFATASALELAQAAPDPGYGPPVVVAMHRRSKPSPSPSGSPSVSASAAPAAPPTEQPTADPHVQVNPSDAPTQIPTLAPTPRPVAPIQPTVPQTVTDPNALGIIARPIRELTLFTWMFGTWHAHNIAELPDGRQKDFGLTTYVFAPTMHGRWIFGADGRAKDEMYISYDPFARRYVLLRIQSNPSYGLWVSTDGWRSNRIVFLTNFSYVNGRQYRRRLTIIHRNSRNFAIYNEEQLPDGSWTADDSVELSKQPQI
jgi:hypothetical protein